MGTYTKPEIIKNDPFSAAREGINRGAKQLATNRIERKKREATAAGAAAKAAAEKEKRERLKDKDAEKYRTKLNSLSQPKIEAFPDKFKSFADGLIDELMLLPYESNDWNKMVGRITNYTDLSNNAMKLLEREVASFKGSYGLPQGSANGTVSTTALKSGVSGARLKTRNKQENDWWILMDTFVNKKGAGIEFSTGDKGGAVGLTMEHPDNERIDPNTQATYYLQPGDKDYEKPITLNFAAYQDRTMEGYDLISVTSQEDFNDGIKNSFQLAGGKSVYNDLKEQIENITRSGGKINTQQIISYERSNQMIKDKIMSDLNAFLPDNRNARQNTWQMLQGEALNTTNEDWSVFDENNQGMRDAYATLLGDKVVADFAKEDKEINKLKNVKPSDKAVRLNNYRTNGIPIGFNNPSDQTRGITDNIMIKDANNQIVGNLTSVIEGGKMTPANIKILAETIGPYQDSNGDYSTRGDVIIDILQNSGSTTGKQYEHGRDLKTKIFNEYSALAALATGSNSLTEDQVLQFAAGKMQAVPSDKATWVDPNATAQVMANFNGADNIHQDDVWETGGARAKKIAIGDKKFNSKAFEQLLYESLDLSAAERRDLMSGAPVGGGAATTTTNKKVGYKTQAEAQAAAKPNQTVYEVKGSWFIN